MMRRFDVNEYVGNYVMVCNTKEDAATFCEYLNEVGRCWCDGMEYSRRMTNFDVIPVGNSIAYYFNKGTYGRRSLIGKEYTVLNFSDFDWHKDYSSLSMSFDEMFAGGGGKL